MTDIKERLRTAYLTGPDRDVLIEAADEIDRLEAEIRHLQAEQRRANSLLRSYLK